MNDVKYDIILDLLTRELKSARIRHLRLVANLGFLASWMFAVVVISLWGDVPPRLIMIPLTWAILMAVFGVWMRNAARGKEKEE